MKKQIQNSIVAAGKSTINNAAIKKTETENDSEKNTIAAIKESIVAKNGSQITDATIDIKREKKKSFCIVFL
ncbi:MAG: hypothetical protein FWC36_07630 [Spirochaetes bacterium]|nr:hypothetical protein [Spirochaetota bacterium]